MQQLTSFRSTFSSAYANTIFDECTYARVSFIFTFWSVFKSTRFGETLSLSRTDTIISRSGSPHDAWHLPSYSFLKYPYPYMMLYYCRFFKFLLNDRSFITNVSHTRPAAKRAIANYVHSSNNWHIWQTIRAI